MGNAFELLEDNFYEKNSDIVNRIGVSGIDNLLLAEEVIDNYLSSSETLEEKRHALKRILNCILQFYRDLLVVKIRNVYGTGKKATPLFNADHEDTLQRCAGYLTQKQITAIINDILESIKFIDYNLNINLLVENIFTRIAMLNSSERE
jgi:DNA polymerase-3 subunit delta'